jgi:hypothetical protein
VPVTFCPAVCVRGPGSIQKPTVGDKLAPKHFAVGYSTSSIFHIGVGKQYVVYGIALWRGLLSYLIVGDYERPEWYPSDIFEVTNARLPPTWHFAFFGQNDETWVNAIWGYEEYSSGADQYFQSNWSPVGSYGDISIYQTLGFRGH